MKILQIGKFFPPYYYGGIESVSFALHNALQGKDDICADFLGFLPKNFSDNIKVDEHICLCKTDIDKFSTQFSKSFVKKYKSIKDEYDIIFVNMPHPVANLVLNFFPPKKAKIILYWHADIIKQKKLLFFYKPFLINLIKKSVAVAAPTQVHLDESDFSNYFKGKKNVLPFILNYKTQEIKYKLSYEDKKVIFACGRLIYYKGFDVLIEAAKFIDENAEVHISGTGALKESLEKLITKNGVQNKVKLLGRLSDEQLQEEYKNCYLYCFPSVNRGEMMGMVQYEALSYGKPIVSTDIPRSGAPTLNIEGKTGFHVPINDSKSLAEKINVLLRDEKLYKEFCNNAVKISKQYNNPKIIEMYISLFDKVLSSSKK